MNEEIRDLRERIDALPGMNRLLAALEGLPPAYLVGGAVRDLLRGAESVDLDVALGGDADHAADELAVRLGGEARHHERFGTATIDAGDLSLDIAATRRERYRSPGALPDVEPATIEQDLGRRDFTVNAMAAPLAPEERGNLHDPYNGRRDLDAGVIRVLHRGSFVDDPTRLLRAIRYEARLGFAMDRDTDALARAAVVDRLSDTVSGERLGAELIALLGEERVEYALSRLVDVGLDGALGPGLEIDPRRAAEAAGEAAGVGADPALAALAVLAGEVTGDVAAWVEGLGLGASRRDRALRAARVGPELAATLGGDPALAPSGVRRLFDREPPEALAVALAFGAPPEPIVRYLDEVRDVRLDIGGDDLVAAGVPPSPALGRALAETLRRKLDGEVAGRDEELRVALELARAESDAEPGP